MPTPDRKRVVLPAAILVFLGWRAPVALFELGPELLRLDPVRLSSAVSDTESARIERTLGRDKTLYDTVRELVPPTDRLLIASPSTERAKRVVTSLRSLLYPQRVVYLEQLPAVASLGGFAGTDTPHLLELDSEADLPLEEHFELVSEQPQDFRLWKLKRSDS